MTEKIIYVANDGSEFENKEECTKYEESFNDFLMFDSEGQQTNLIYDCNILVIKTDDAAKKFFEKFHDSYVLPWSMEDSATSGIWFWDDGADYWMNYNYIMNTINIINEICERENLG